MGLGLKSDLNMHRAHSGSLRVRIEARHEWVEPGDFRNADLPTSTHPLSPENRVTEPPCPITGETKWPAAARNLIPLSRFPQGQAGAGGFPPRRGALPRLPPQEGFQNASLKPPLRIPPVGLNDALHTRMEKAW